MASNRAPKQNQCLESSSAIESASRMSLFSGSPSSFTFFRKIKSDANAILTKSAATFDHAFKGKVPLVGVLNVETNDIILYPCITERVWLQASDSSGDIEKAWQQEKDWVGNLCKGLPIDDATVIAKYKSTVFAPRAISIGESRDCDKISSHLFILHLINDMDNKINYRGFSLLVSKSEPGTFDYVFESASLNRVFFFGSKIIDDAKIAIILEQLKDRYPPSKRTLNSLPKTAIPLVRTRQL